MSDKTKSIIHKQGRLYILVKIDKAEYDYYCICPSCSKSIYHRIENENWEIIRTGLHEEIQNQKIMLNKLYGKK